MLALFSIDFEIFQISTSRIRANSTLISVALALRQRAMSVENDSKKKIPGQTENDELREILGIRDENIVRRVLRKRLHFHCRAEDVSTISKYPVAPNHSGRGYVNGKYYP